MAFIECRCPLTVWYRMFEINYQKNSLFFRSQIDQNFSQIKVLFLSGQSISLGCRVFLPGLETTDLQSLPVSPDGHWHWQYWFKYPPLSQFGGLTQFSVIQIILSTNCFKLLYWNSFGTKILITFRNLKKELSRTCAAVNLRYFLCIVIHETSGFIRQKS